MIISLFTFWRIGLFLVGYLGSLAFPKVSNGGPGSVSGGKFDYLTSWAQWDGGHYLDIAKVGYLRDTDYAFFPLFPLLARLTNRFFPENIILSGLVLTNIFFIIFLIVFHKYVAKISSQKTALTTITTLLVFPTTFYTIAFYSESLFLFLLAATFLFLSSRKYLEAAVAVSFASITRLVGVFLTLSLFWVYSEHLKFNIKKIDRKIFHLLVAFFAFAIYAIYLWYKNDDPLRFLTVQRIWNREVTDPVSTVSSYLWAYVIGEKRPINDFFDLITTIFFLSVLIIGRKKISSSLWIFSILVILIPASTGTLTSMPRYALSSLGTFIIIGKYLEENPKLKIPVWSVSLITQVYLLVRFINGYWVA